MVELQGASFACVVDRAIFLRFFRHALMVLSFGCIGWPRDSDLQQDGLGRKLDAQESKQLRRGDLIFWNEHVAIVRDADTIVHANGYHMATAIENTKAAVARISAAGNEVLAVKWL